jgi:O-antigen/teichoic acid export membrane protein
MALATVFFSLVVWMCQNLLKWTFDRRRFVLLSVGWVATSVGLVVLFVTAFDLGVTGVFLGYLVSTVVFAVLGVAAIRGFLTVPRTFDQVPALLAFGWPAMLVALACAAMPSFDRWFVQRALGLELLAGYAVALKIASLINIPAQGFMAVWTPFAYATYRDELAEQSYRGALRWYVALLAFGGLGLVFLADPLVRVFASSKYLDSIGLVRPLVFALLIEAATIVTGIGLELSKRMTFKAAGYIAGVVAGVVFVPFGIHVAGLVGAVWGVALARLALAVVTTVLAYRQYPLRFDFAPVAVTMTTFLVAASAMGSWPQPESVIRWGLDAAVLTVAGLVLFGFGLRPSDRALVRVRRRAQTSDGPTGSTGQTPEPESPAESDGG